MNKIIGRKKEIEEFTGKERDAESGYTGDFEATYRDVIAGCTSLLATLQGE